MARSQRKYDHEYKVQTVKLAKEIGGAKAQCGQLKEFIKILHVFSKKLLTKPPKSAVASRPVNQGIVRFAANLDYTLGGMSYESN